MTLMVRRYYMTWSVTIRENDNGTVSFIYDKNVDRYKFIGLMEVEIEIMKKEMIASMHKPEGA